MISTLVVVVCASYQNIKQPEWSKPVAGLEARVEFERRGEKAGTPKLIPYLVLKNVTDSIGTVDVFLSHSNLKLKLVNAKGMEIPDKQSGLNGRNGFVPNPFWLMIPYDSTVRINASLYGYFAREKGELLIETDSGLLFVPLGTKGDVFVTGTFSVNDPPHEARSMRWEGTLDLPKVKVFGQDGMIVR